ncbi:imidazole glycerol phosphate synthase subunit HisF [Candidatus Vidania fulgoroideorum]
MLCKRIICCLDLKNGNIVKGKRFLNLIKFKNPKKIALNYYKQGADEIVLLNINKQKINKFKKTVKKISEKIRIPITVGGNITTVKEAKILFNSGADRICLNSSLFKKNLVEKISDKFGSQSTIASIDVRKKKKADWIVYTNGGKCNTGINIIKWANICVLKGIGEILLTSIDMDGTNKGFDIKLLNYVNKNIDVPVIPSGGGGDYKSIFKLFNKTKINSVLLASSLHKNLINIKKLKTMLSKKFNIREK